MLDEDTPESESLRVNANCDPFQMIFNLPLVKSKSEIV